MLPSRAARPLVWSPPTLALATLASLSTAGLPACDMLFHRGALPSLDHFEGELDFAARGSFAKGAAEPAIITVHVKDDKLRFDLPSGPPAAGSAPTGSFLFDSPAKRFYILNAGQKQAIQFDMTDDKSKPPPAEAPVVTKTDRRSLVAGFACDDWEVTLPDQKKETICVATKPASFFNMPVAGGLPGVRGWMSQVFDGQHVPLRLIASDTHGVETGRLELTRVERKPEDASLFGVPSGFQTIDVAQLLQERSGSSFGGHPAHPDLTVPDPANRAHPRPSHS